MENPVITRIEKAKGRETVPNPWPASTSFTVTGALAIPGIMGIYALAKKAPRRLPLQLSFWVALTTALRRFICARCDYYGEYCSTLMGKWTALFLERESEPLETAGFYWDAILGACIILYPLPQAFKISWKFAVVYLASWVAALALFNQLACSICPIQACPMPGRGRGRGGNES